MLEIIQTVEQWLKDGRKVALATVVETWGSAPRRAGSKMAVTEDMAMVGSVSGGCVEVAVVEQSLEVLAGKAARLLKYGVSDDTAWEVGLTCGGRISIFVEPLQADWWKLVTQHIQSDQPAITITRLEGEDAGQKLLVNGRGDVLYTSFDSAYHQALIAGAVHYAIPQKAEIEGLKLMIDVHRPRPHLIIIGGVHVAQPLQSFARQLGFRVSLVDPRGVFASAERFPEVSNIVHSYPDKALPQLGLDADTYIAVLTHDPKIDDKALIAALPSHAPYVGVLSSRKTHDARVERLQKAGLSPEHIARVHTPIGVGIETRTPEEIALSIMTEIIGVRNKSIQSQPAPQAVP